MELMTEPQPVLNLVFREQQHGAAAIPERTKSAEVPEPKAVGKPVAFCYPDDRWKLAGSGLYPLLGERNGCPIEQRAPT